MSVNHICAVRLHTALSTTGRMLLVAALLIAATASAGAAAAPTAAPGAAQGLQQPAGLHLVVENVGQYAAEARFLLTQGDQRIWLTDDAVWLTVPDPLTTADRRPPTAGREPSAVSRRRPAVTPSGTAIRFTFPGANPAATLEPFGRMPTHVSYLIGNDPSRWQRDVPVWSGVRYRNLYPGVNLVIDGDAAGVVPWRFEVQPGADIQAVTLRVEGADTVRAEAGQLRLEMKGRAVGVALPAWSLAEQASPLRSAVVRQAGDGAFVVAPESQGQAGQAPEAGPAGVAAAGDLIYSRLLGGSALDAGYGIAVDYAGNAYLTGETASAVFPVLAGSFDLSYNGAIDAFVAKVDAAGTALLYATYLGGTDEDLGAAISVNGNLAYVVGETKSTNFPGTTAAAQATDIFVVSLNEAGSNLRYASLLGGAAFDTASGIAVEGTDAYIVGSTDSTNLAGTGCAGSTPRNLVVAKLDALGAPAYTTCLGGSDFDAGYAIAVRSGVAYVTGESLSTDLPGSPQAGAGDILVATFAANGTLSSSKLIGGSAEDWGSGIALDGDGNITIAGATSSSDFPTNPAASFGGGLTDGVIVRLLPGLTTDYAAYLGGNGEDYGYGVAADTVQGLYVTGTTASTDFPVTAGAYDTTPNGLMDVFVARMHLASTLPNKVTYATYLGRTSDEWAYSAATDTGGHAFVTGSTASSGFPTTGGPPLGGADDAFVAKLKVSSPPDAPAVTIAASGASASLSWANTAVRYQVFQSSRPFFIPGDWSSPTPVADGAANSYLDTNALNQVDVRFYVVKAVDATPAASANSNRVGKFTYQLVPGLN